MSGRRRRPVQSQALGFRCLAPNSLIFRFSAGPVDDAARTLQSNLLEAPTSPLTWGKNQFADRAAAGVPGNSKHMAFGAWHRTR